MKKSFKTKWSLEGFHLTLAHFATLGDSNPITMKLGSGVTRAWMQESKVCIDEANKRGFNMPNIGTIGVKLKKLLKGGKQEYEKYVKDWFPGHQIDSSGDEMKHKLDTLFDTLLRMRRESRLKQSDREESFEANYEFVIEENVSSSSSVDSSDDEDSDNDIKPYEEIQGSIKTHNNSSNNEYHQWDIHSLLFVFRHFVAIGSTDTNPVTMLGRGKDRRLAWMRESQQCARNAKIHLPSARLIIAKLESFLDISETAFATYEIFVNKLLHKEKENNVNDGLEAIQIKMKVYKKELDRLFFKLNQMQMDAKSKLVDDEEEEVSSESEDDREHDITNLPSFQQQRPGGISASTLPTSTASSSTSAAAATIKRSWCIASFEYVLEYFNSIKDQSNNPITMSKGSGITKAWSYQTETCVEQAKEDDVDIPSKFGILKKIKDLLRCGEQSYKSFVKKLVESDDIFSSYDSKKQFLKLQEMDKLFSGLLEIKRRTKKRERVGRSRKRNREDIESRVDAEDEEAGGLNITTIGKKRRFESDRNEMNSEKTSIDGKESSRELTNLRKQLLKQKTKLKHETRFNKCLRRSNKELRHSNKILKRSNKELKRSIKDLK